MRRTLPAVVVIIAAACLIRLWHIERESFWADEGWTIALARGPALSDVARTMVADQHPPLYFMLVRLWMDVFGESEYILRLFSTFWSLVGVAAIYRLAADAFGPGAGLIAALLLALQDNDIMLAREARHYAMMATLAALSALFYLRYLRRPTRAHGLGWFAASVALLYTHYLGALLLAVQAAHALIAVRPLRRLIDMFARLALIGLAWLPWALVFIDQSSWRYTRPEIFRSGLPNSPETFTLVRGDLLGSHFALTGGLALLGLFSLAYRSGGVHLAWRRAREVFFFALWLILPVAALVLVNARAEILTTRNFLLVVPPLLVLVAHGLLNLERTARLFTLCVMVFLALFTVDAYHIKPPYRQISADIVAYRASTDPVLMDVWVDDFALRYHLGRAAQSDPAALPLVSLREWRAQYRENFTAYLLEYLRDKQAFWLAYWGQNQDGLLDWLLERGYARTAALSYAHQGETIWLWRYDRPPTAARARFGDVFALHAANINVEIIRPGETLRVNLLWSAVVPPGRDYSVSVFVLDANGAPRAGHDSAPFEGRLNTSAWTPGALHFDSHALRLPLDAPPGRYTLGVKVYWYGDGLALTVQGAEYLTVGEIAVE